jgi:DNA polymerase III subunit beta
MATATVAPPPPAEKPVDVPLMEFIADRNQLLAEVTVAARATDSRSTQPLLSHLLLHATGDGVLSITGSDLKRTITTECPAAIKTLGEAAVPAQKLLNYLKLLPEGRVSMKLLANYHMQITAGHSRTKMSGLAPKSFPSAPSSSVTPLRLSSRGLKTLIRQSLFAVANSEDRYLFNAALLLLREDRMGMVATDGRRLSLVEVQEDSLAIDGFKKVLLPRDCMSDLLSLFGSSKEESVGFSEDDSTYFFQLGHRTFSVRKLIGQFPNYEAILPRDTANSVVIGAKDLLGSVQRVLEFSDEKSSAVKLHLEKNSLTVSASAMDRGESQEVLPLSYTAAAATIGFNGHFIVEFLKTIGAEGEVRLALKDSASAAVITPEAFNPEYQQKYVVMPMRI